MNCPLANSKVLFNTVRWTAALPVAAASYAAVRMGVLSLLPQLQMPLLGALSGWVLSDWTGSILFILLATIVAPSHKHIVACASFFVLSIAHSVMLIEATKHTISPQHSTETIYLTAIGGFFVSAVFTYALVQHYLGKQREAELTADARRYYREWADQSEGEPKVNATRNQQSAPAQGPPSRGAVVQRAEPAVPQYETKVLQNESLPREMNVTVSLSFDDDLGLKKFVVADGKSVGFIKTALLLGLVSPGQALKFVFKSKKAKKPALLKNPPWFNARREIDADIPDPAIASGEKDGSRLLTDTHAEYR